MLKFLYETILGRIILKGLTSPSFSRLCGRIADSRVSSVFIKPFVHRNGIDINEFYPKEWKCFNDCFCRRIREGLRPFDEEPSALCAPCDGHLSVYHINGKCVMPIKQSMYTIPKLLGNSELAREFENGLCLVFRLGVDNYHRYCYFDKGRKGSNHFIPGILHTVRPIALDKYPVFVENCREYTVMDTENFGRAVQVEVGAMMVGRICNNHEEYSFNRGEEKGCFMYGGSTIILLLKKNAVKLSEAIDGYVGTGLEISVKMGQKIGESIGVFMECDRLS